MARLNQIIEDDLATIVKNELPWENLFNKTVLISGANGFLPAYMVETILFLNRRFPKQRIKVIALVRNRKKAEIRFSDYLKDTNLIFLEQDVCQDVVANEKINFIIHAASQASPKYYGTDPVGTLSANVLGTINLIKLAYKNSVESFVYFSSSEVYGQVREEEIPIAENTFGYLNPTQVRACYAESKRMGENICVSWFHQYGTKAKIVRPFHTYGPKMALDDGRVYADFVADAIAGRNIQMKSDGSASRAFCYLTDATVAFFTVLLLGENGEAYNVGNPYQEYSILDLARKISVLFKEKEIKLVELAPQSTEVYLKSPVSRVSPNIDKLMRLGWRPLVSVEEGFARTILSYQR